MNKTTLKIKNSIEKLFVFKSSLITEAVTGQLDIDKWKSRGATNERLDAIEEDLENAPKEKRAVC